MAENLTNQEWHETPPTVAQEDLSRPIIVVCARDFGPLEKPKRPTRTSSAKHYFDLVLACTVGHNPKHAGGSTLMSFLCLRTQFLIYKTINSEQFFAD